MLPCTYITLLTTLALQTSWTSDSSISFFWDDVKGTVSRSHLHFPEQVDSNCKRTRPPHIPSELRLPVCVHSSLLYVHTEVSHTVVLLTSAQGQTLFVRLKTHLICREENFQLSFKAVAQLWRGSATSRGNTPGCETLVVFLHTWRLQQAIQSVLQLRHHQE